MRLTAQTDTADCRPTDDSMPRVFTSTSHNSRSLLYCNHCRLSLARIGSCTADEPAYSILNHHRGRYRPHEI
eukprot:scaffold137657_cov36-Attheya_sp.AAC.1